MSCLRKFAFQHRNFINFIECKRFAGHSKWANIKHTKMEKDLEKSALMQTYIKKMKIAIAGKSAKPDDNVQLARLIEQAKERSLPMATIKSFLEKAEKSKTGSKVTVCETKGPSGCIVLIQLLTDNFPHFRNLLNTHLRKANFGTSEMPAQSIYDEKGIILAEIGDLDLDKVLEDAIEVGAEEAERLKENDKEFFQFTCHANELFKVRNKLDALGYKIIQADTEFVPKVYVTLTDEEMEIVSKLYDRLSNIEEVIKIHNNISQI